MKIVIDLTAIYDHLTGIERYALEMSGNLMKQFPENEYCLLFKNEIHKEFKAGGRYSLRNLSGDRDNISYKILKGGNKLIFNQLTLLKVLNKIKADAYLFMSFPEPILFNKKNIYTTVHDVGCWDCGENMKFLSKIYFRCSYRHSFRNAKRIITISEFSKGRIESVGKLPTDKVKLVYAAVENRNADCDNKSLARKADLEDYGINDKYILSLSTLEPRKNIKLLLDGYSKLVEKDDSVAGLVLAGRMGWLMEDFLKGYSEKVLNKIILTGFVKDKDLPALYSNAEFFVFPSKYEGFGIPPLEAMAYGTTVLSSDAASMPEVLGDAAVFFENENEESLISKLEEMLAMPEDVKEKYINLGKERVKRFNWSEEAKKLMKIITTAE